jgi:galactitol-specific phosphotransferase system IIB component
MFVKLYNKEKQNKNKTKQNKQKTKKKDIFLIKQQVYKSFPMIPNFIVSINLLISAIDKQYLYPLPRTVNKHMISQVE